jgi:hypothetical protein
MRGYYTNFRDANSQAVQPDTANSNAADTHGAASAGGGVGSPLPSQAPAPAHLIEKDGFVTVYPPLEKDQDQ